MAYPDPETLKKNRRKAIQYGVINITVLIIITYICVRSGMTVWQYYLVIGSFMVISIVTMWLWRKRRR